ncbi:MAG: PLP-dependent aminotransferase family protein [Hamadaea sp.]|uniref:MocR-like pyridoxine biosynthesis transcription factor PdxR n=1 Tax=Hamadaea sp. TaxID=2024425 RepID=UPI001808F9ED|nr:PLP-dependent aminotransferase family protein [Hamadaea sp.]NUR70620.1 PLP-dependent aminotransferase family protein [Hamadaea sp.]NUT22358.1 PLP-dependent aminotransferase family protein [Hamadaea sp.]
MAIDWANFGVDLHLELAASAGRRTALEEALREAIRSGRLAPETRLPATRTLAAELGLARGTVSAAYDQLIAEGYLTARQGSFTTVASLAATTSPVSVEPASTGTPRYDLRPGSPDVSTFPVAAWIRAVRRALSRAPSAAFDYGDPRGSLALRTVLAEYLGRARGVLASPDRIVVTSGYVQALSLLATVYKGRTFGLEDPGLDFHREVVRAAGTAVVPVSVDSLGARLPIPGADAVVLTPAHQYPMGVTLHPERRRTAVEWARSGDRLIIEDDYDGEFRYDRQPVGALQGTAPDHVVYIGTAAKTLSPALRLAWMVLPAYLVEPVVRLKRLTDLHTEIVGQLALADLISEHAYDRHIRAGRLRYRRRRDELVARLPGADLGGIAAGLHVVLRLPAGVTEREVLAAAAARGLAIGALGTHWHSPGAHPQGLVLGYGTPRDGVYSAALDTLARLLRGF